MSLRRAVWSLLALAVVGACSDDGDASKAQSDADAVAMVERAQQVGPPVQPVKLEPITAEDAAANNLFGAGCAFIGHDAPTDPLVITNSERAVIKLAGRLVVLASDPGGRQLPLGSWAHYVGKAHSIILGPVAAAHGAAGGAPSGWDTTLSVHDPQDRIVFGSSGRLECGA